MVGMVAIVHSVALVGVEGALVQVETDPKAGLPGVHLIGMGNKAVNEARERVRSAIPNSQLDFPAKKLVVNLAPAELPKDGSHFDLAIAISILVASGSLKEHQVKGRLFAGELALDGSVRPIRGALLITQTAQQQGFTEVFIPRGNYPQASLVDGVTVIGVASLTELYLHLKGVHEIPLPSTQGSKPGHSTTSSFPTIDSIHGHEQVKRAITIAAAGRHNILLSGPPGGGKTLLARVLAGLLPGLSPQEVLEVTKIQTVVSGLDGVICTNAPFRAPHHSITPTSFTGGGLKPRPGEVSLAHKGVLLLDELPEYPSKVLESLRQPLEDKFVSISRHYGRITFPADFILVATMNPCTCGFFGNQQTACHCTPQQVQAYRKRVSGPLLDRIDLTVHVEPVDTNSLVTQNTLQLSQQSKVLESIIQARTVQSKRYNRSTEYNSSASLSTANRHFNIQPQAQVLLVQAAKKLALSTRGYLKVLRVARTIADLENSPTIEPNHLAEALQFRQLSHSAPSAEGAS